MGKRFNIWRHMIRTIWVEGLFALPLTTKLHYTYLATRSFLGLKVNKSDLWEDE